MANFKFKTMGVMIDMSRNAVMSVEGLKRFLRILKKWDIIAQCSIPRTPMRLTMSAPKACKRRLLDYADGKIECIEELEGDLLPFGTKEESIIFNNYANNATINVF